MNKLLASTLLGMSALLFGCGGWNPGPGPQPPDPPTPEPPPVAATKYLDMLLRAGGPSNFVTRDGEPVEFRGAISCCMDDPDWSDKASGWPVNFSPAWQDYAGVKFHANFFHGRLGPFLKGGTAFDDPWDTVGGPYLDMGNDRVDLTTFNQGYWNLIKEWIEYAGDRKRYVEIDLIDGWYCKHGNWGDVKMPWMSEHNIQGENHVQACSAGEIMPGLVFDNFIRKAVSEFGGYGNVIWQDGNEIGITGQYNPEWSLSMQQRVRYWEQEVGHGVVHMFGTNSNHPTVMSQVDFIEGHQRTPWTQPQHGRISLVNEYNPKPTYSPEVMNSYRCLAEKAGTFWWYWRHNQTLEQMESTAALFLLECPDDPTVPPPIGKCPKGTPQARINWHQKGTKWIADGTPAVCGANYTPDCYKGRACHPVACEGEANSELRRFCETQLMGGVKPVWELQVYSGTLSLAPHDWFGIVKGTGKGRLRWSFPNGTATSKWLDIDK